MNKRKVQTIIFYCDTEGKKHFLLLKLNKKRGFFWQSVTGGVDEGEDFVQAALREAQEETQITTKNIKNIIETNYEFEFVDQYKNEVIEKVFIIEAKLIWDVVIDPSEHDEFKWVPESQITQESVKFESNYKALKIAMEIK